MVNRAELDAELKLACPGEQTDLAAPVDIMTEGKVTGKEFNSERARGWD